MAGCHEGHGAAPRGTDGICGNGRVVVVLPILRSVECLRSLTGRWAHVIVDDEGAVSDRYPLL